MKIVRYQLQLAMLVQSLPEGISTLCLTSGHEV